MMTVPPGCGLDRGTQATRNRCFLDAVPDMREYDGEWLHQG